MAYTIKKIKFHEEYMVDEGYGEGKCSLFIKDSKLNIGLMAYEIVKKLTLEEIKSYIENIYNVYSKYDSIEVDDDDLFQLRIKSIAKDLTIKFKNILKLIDEDKYDIKRFKNDIQGTNINILVFMFKDYLYSELEEYHIRQDKFFDDLNIKMHGVITDVRVISLYKRYESRIERYVEDVILLDKGEYIYLQDFKELETMKNDLKEDEYLVLVENYI